MSEKEIHSLLTVDPLTPMMPYGYSYEASLAIRPC